MPRRKPSARKQAPEVQLQETKFVDDGEIAATLFADGSLLIAGDTEPWTRWQDYMESEHSAAPDHADPTGQLATVLGEAIPTNPGDPGDPPELEDPPAPEPKPKRTRKRRAKTAAPEDPEASGEDPPSSEPEDTPTEPDAPDPGEPADPPTEPASKPKRTSGKKRAKPDAKEQLLGAIEAQSMTLFDELDQSITANPGASSDPLYGIKSGAAWAGIDVSRCAMSRLGDTLAAIQEEFDALKRKGAPIGEYNRLHAMRRKAAMELLLCNVVESAEEVPF